MSSQKAAGGDGGAGQPLAAGQEGAPALPPPPTGPTPEELQAKIDGLINEKADAMEEQIRSHYDQQLKELQKQLESAQKEKKDREEQLVKQRQQEEDRKRREAESQQQAELEKKRAAEEEAANKAAAEQAAKVAAAEAAPPPPAAAPPPKPAQPQVRRGDLVEPGPGVTPPKLTNQAPARFPEMARKVGKTAATVTVRVLVDENGKVIDTQVAEKVGFGFDAEALQVAKKSTFSPATKGGVPVKMWIEFKVGFKG
jgi:TonB family protein